MLLYHSCSISLTWRCCYNSCSSTSRFTIIRWTWWGWGAYQHVVEGWKGDAERVWVRITKRKEGEEVWKRSNKFTSMISCNWCKEVRWEWWEVKEQENVAEDPLIIISIILSSFDWCLSSPSELILESKSIHSKFLSSTLHSFLDPFQSSLSFSYKKGGERGANDKRGWGEGWWRMSVRQQKWIMTLMMIIMKNFQSTSVRATRRLL